MTPADHAEPVRREYVVRGRVQGVGFRWFVLHHAQALGIAGWVSNAPDGSVAVVGQASAEILDRFEAILMQGPPAARVQHLEVRSIPHDVIEFNSFTIKH